MLAVRFVANLSLASALVIGLSMAAAPSRASAEPDYVPGEIIVKLKGSSKQMKSQAFIGKAVSEKSMSLKASFSEMNMHHFKMGISPSAKEFEQALNDLRADPDVEFAEPNYILRKPDMQGYSVGSEESVSMADVHSNAYSAYSQTSAPIAANNAWAAMAASATPIVVGIIDTGVDMNHEIFRDSGAIWTNPGEVAGNGIDDDGNGYVDDVHGWNFVSNNNSPMDDDNHGTHVAGIVLGVSQDITASPIAAAKIRIMPLKFLDGNGVGTTSDAVRAIYYGVNAGARVLNNSWGGGGYSNALLDAIAYAYNHRVVFVAAAGNSSANNDVTPTYPANYSVPGLISVAATTDSDVLASFSNYGRNTVHLGSPGSGIWSSLPNQSYGRASGTSMASPFVAGLAAIMLRDNPALSAYQVKELILTNAQLLASLSTKTTAKARMNSYNSLMAAKGATGATEQPAFAAASRDVASEEVQAAGCGLVKELIDDASGPSGPQRNVAFFGLLLIFAAPILIALSLRRTNGRSRRRFPRYQIASQVRMKVGDRELVGEVSSISMGGIQMATDAWLENGGVVSMSIKSPDGNEEINVAGKVVWSEEKKRYGVAFQEADTSALNSIARWTTSLLKAN